MSGRTGAGAHVDFVREAPPLNPSWMPHSQAFCAAEVLGVTDATFDELFDAIHVERRALRSAEAIAAFVGELGTDGVDEARLLETMKSFAVQTRIRAAMAKARAAEISGVPAIVVDGRYRTSGRLAGSDDAVIDVIERLSAR